MKRIVVLLLVTVLLLTIALIGVGCNKVMKFEIS